MAIRQHVTPTALIQAAGAIALALLTAGLTYFLTADLNTESAVKQQNSASVLQFEGSGAKMDTSLSVLVDAILDGRGVSEARKEARTAVTLHAAEANQLRTLVGNGNVDQYINSLGDLRELTDQASDRKSAQRMAQLHVNIMDYRVRMVSSAREQYCCQPRATAISSSSEKLPASAFSQRSAMVSSALISALPGLHRPGKWRKAAASAGGGFQKYRWKTTMPRDL